MIGSLLLTLWVTSRLSIELGLELILDGLERAQF
jgi:hypothetical protein